MTWQIQIFKTLYVSIFGSFMRFLLKKIMEKLTIFIVKKADLFHALKIAKYE